MDWNTLTYTRLHGHEGEQLIRYHRSRPSKVSWSQHALWRADDRGHMSRADARRWFATSAYLGRWDRSEVWGDDQYVVIGIRDKEHRRYLTITTFMPRAYWDYDVAQYDMMMNRLATRGESYGKKDDLRTAE